MQLRGFLTREPKKPANKPAYRWQTGLPTSPKVRATAESKRLMKMQPCLRSLMSTSHRPQPWAVKGHHQVSSKNIRFDWRMFWLNSALNHFWKNSESCSPHWQPIVYMMTEEAGPTSSSSPSTKPMMKSSLVKMLRDSFQSLIVPNWRSKAKKSWNR